MDEDWSLAVCQLLSKNDDKHVLKVTEEEELQRYVNELKHEFEKDLRKIRLRKEKQEEERQQQRQQQQQQQQEQQQQQQQQQGEEEKEDMRVKFPKYMTRLKIITGEFGKVHSGFRRIMSMPNFLVGLMMASRVGRHYLHAPWFTVLSFSRMADVHGSVSRNGKGRRVRWRG
jgi:hypothetical protein